MNERVIVTTGNTDIYLINEPTYTAGSADNIRKYDQELCRVKNDYISCAHGLLTGDIESPDKSVVLLGIGGATGVHIHSLVCTENNCFVAVGDSVYSIAIPSLELNWCVKVDFATCFGIYLLPENNCLISWGEVDIKRLNLNGEISWSFSGADIFTENLEILENCIEVTDFNNQIYKIDIKSGQSI